MEAGPVFYAPTLAAPPQGAVCAHSLFWDREMRRKNGVIHEEKL